MARLRLDPSSLQKVRRNFKQVYGKLDLADAMNDAGQIIEHSAASMAPVDTGALRDSITTEVISSSRGVGRVFIGPDKRMRRWKRSRGSSPRLHVPVDYAIFQEFGTSKIRGHKYMRKALAKNRRRYFKLSGRYIFNQLK